MTLHHDTELRHSLDVLRTRWRLMGGIGVLATVVATLVPTFTGTLYEVSTTIKMEVRGRIEDGDVNTVAEYWRGEALLGEVLTRLGLRSLYSYAAAHLEVEAEDQGLRLIVRSRNPQEGRAIAQMLAAKLMADHQRRRNLLLRTKEELRGVIGELQWQTRVLEPALAAGVSEKAMFRRRAKRTGINPRPAPFYPPLLSSHKEALSSYQGLLSEVEQHLSELIATQISVGPPRVAPLSPLPTALQRFLAAAALGVVGVFAVGLVAGQPHRVDWPDVRPPGFHLADHGRE